MIKKLLHQDPISHLKGNGPRVILLNLLFEMQEMSQNRSAAQNECLYNIFLYQEKPKKVEEALQDADWVLSMQGELN